MEATQYRLRSYKQAEVTTYWMEESEGVYSSVLRRKRPGHLKFRYVFGRPNSSQDLKVVVARKGTGEEKCDDATLHI